MDIMELGAIGELVGGVALSGCGCGRATKSIGQTSLFAQTARTAILSSP